MTPELPDAHADANLDTYFTAGYGQAAAYSQGGEFLNYVSPDGLVQIPLVVRKTSGGIVDAQSPYGYAGIRYASDTHELPNWDEIYSDLASRDILSVFIRQHPFVPAPPPPAGVHQAVVDHPTYRIDAQPEDDAWASFSVRARRSVRKGIKAGLTVDIRPAQAEDLQAEAPFRRIYDEAMRRLDARDFYFFDDTYYRLLLDGLGENLLLATASNAEGTAVGALLLMRGNENLHYHLSGATEEGLHTRATPLLIWESTRYLASTDISGGLYLGGGFPAGGGLDEFKRSFGRTPVPYNAYGIVTDSDGYEEAVAKRKALGPIEDDSFFPLYRAEVPSDD